jgi:hypothetical protein
MSANGCPFPPRLRRLIRVCIRIGRSDDKSISVELGLSITTTHSYFRDAIELAEVNSRPELILKAIGQGWDKLWDSDSGGE